MLPEQLSVSSLLLPSGCPCRNRLHTTFYMRGLKLFSFGSQISIRHGYRYRQIEVLHVESEE